MSRERLLIVEDEAVVAEDLRASLTALGYEVAGIAGTAHDALDLAARTRPGLVLMDIKLQDGSDGIAAATQISTQHRIPVVFLTAHADRGTLARASEALPFGYVLKPFEEQGLRASIETALRLHEARLHAEERQRLQKHVQDAQRLESLGLVAGGVAHDFNNVLTAILGNAQLARMSLPPASDAVPMLEAIEEASTRAAELCAHMLAYAGRRETVFAPVDLNDLVARTVEMIRGSLDPRAEFVLQLDPHLPPVRADRAHLQQVVLSLLVNAVESLGALPGVVTLATRELTLERETLRGAALGEAWEPGRYVRLEVRDTGCGMTAATLERIFDPFFTTKFTGRGLGLAAVHGIARSHRAPVFVRSEVGAGTVFEICLPIVIAAPPVAVPELKPLRIRGEGRRVLIVEDELAVLSVVTRIVERLGFTSLPASSGAAALSALALREEKPALVLLDANMPGMDGLATLRALRKLLPATPVMLVSALPEDAALERFAGETIAAVLRKPFRPDQLERKIAEVLG